MANLSASESGYDRVKRMYRKDDYGLMSPEMNFFIQTASSTVIISSIAGGVAHMLKTKENYFRQNTASTFESQHLARRNLTDTMTLNAFKGAAKYALKYGSFSSAYLLCTMTAANYNNRITVWEHIGSGALLGAVFRLNYGLKGMAAAASVGGILGLFAGSILVFNLWLSNKTFDDLHKLQHDSYYQMKRRADDKRSAGSFLDSDRY